MEPREPVKVKLSRIYEILADYMRRMKKEYAPDITDDKLSDGAAVFYMNGNDGTDFDYDVNERTCEFMQFYKSNELGLIKVYVTAKGTLSGILWLNEGKNAICLPDEDLPLDVSPRGIADALMQELDENSEWDEVAFSL